MNLQLGSEMDGDSEVSNPKEDIVLYILFRLLVDNKPSRLVRAVRDLVQGQPPSGGLQDIRVRDLRREGFVRSTPSSLRPWSKAFYPGSRAASGLRRALSPNLDHPAEAPGLTAGRRVVCP